jgi:hypothetical protein
MFLIILPWSFYNLATKGEFILINDASGWVLWAGNVPESLPIYVGDFPTAQAAIDYQNYVGRTLSNQQISEFEKHDRLFGPVFQATRSVMAIQGV